MRCERGRGQRTLNIYFAQGLNPIVYAFLYKFIFLMHDRLFEF